MSHGVEHNNLPPLTGGKLLGAAFILALANFVAVLDLTIANVAVPSIAGSLGTTPNQGTWVITSYAVAEAITVPLTGWLATRFGAVRVFSVCLMLFAIASALCGLMTSLSGLITGRILQGLVGGPLMPLSQALLLRIFPKEKATAALGIWAVTTLTAPVIGPLLGGYLCDNASWPWIFYINVPIALTFAYLAARVLKRYENILRATPIDKVGLVLLVIWVGSLQLMLDEGKNLDWFASPLITGLGITAVIGFIAFLIWELHEQYPVVNLRVFRHRNYSVCLLTISIGFAAFFALNVLTPLWLQTYMSYTAMLAGQVTAWTGVMGVVMAPIVSRLASKIDPRRLISTGLFILGALTLVRCFVTTDYTYWHLSAPLMGVGIGLPFFFIPLLALAMSSVEPDEAASAAGLLSFVRTLSGAFSAAIITTAWENKSIMHHAQLIDQSTNLSQLQDGLQAQGFSVQAALTQTDLIVQSQAVMLATNQLMLILAIAFFIGASVIWLATKPKKPVVLGGGHH